MNEKRRKQIKAEAERRLKLWLSNSSFDEMTVFGSFIRFQMALGLLDGYPFDKKKWMTKNDFNGFITKDEFNSMHYSLILKKLFDECISMK